jgi:hypothetical protein
VENLAPDSPEHLARGLANNAVGYAEDTKAQAEAVAKQVSDNPGVTAAVTLGVLATSLHPYGRIFLSAAGFVMSAYGAACVVDDRIDGVRDEIEGKNDGKKMGQSDVASFLAMFSVPGRAATAALVDTGAALLSGARTISILAEGAGGSPLLVASGAGGDVVVGGAAAAEGTAAGVCVAAPALESEIAGGMTMAMVGVQRWSDAGDFSDHGYVSPNRVKKTPPRNPKGQNGMQNAMVDEAMRMIKRRYGIDPKSDMGENIRKAIHYSLNEEKTMAEVWEIVEQVLVEFGVP